jgi:pimeloyl-ACP methyl ester carboxylesterase
LAAPLVKKGIGALFLENPYYGVRRPTAQNFIAMRRVSDQLLMNYATIEETRALVEWLKHQGHEIVGVTGYSMGGFMTAYASAMLPRHRLAVVPVAAGNSPGNVLTRGALHRLPHWESLAERHAPKRAKRAFAELFSALRVDRLPPLAEPRSAIVVGTRHDAAVPPSEAEALHAHWDGSELRWMRRGHITGFLVSRDPVRKAIFDAFDRLITLETSGQKEQDA